MCFLFVYLHGEGGGSRNRDSSNNENVIWVSDEYVLWDIFNSKAQECSPYFSASPPTTPQDLNCPGRGIATYYVANN